MKELVEIIISYASIWAPALVSILGIITTVVVAINNCSKAISEFKSDEILKDIKSELNNVTHENAELIRCNKLLLDQITKIQGYADAKKKEE